MDYLQKLPEIWIRDCYACADPRYRINVRVVNEKPWGNLFAYNMFLRPSEEELEKYILGQLNKWKGYSLIQFAKEHSIKAKSSKNANANILRTALGFYDKKKQIKEILQLGLSVKTAPCRTSDLYPWESMSFPYQPLGELAEEDRFDESEFYSLLQGFLIIPLLRNKRKKQSLNETIFGRSIIWRPNKEQLLAIQKEWEKIRDIVRKELK